MRWHVAVASLRHFERWLKMAQFGPLKKDVAHVPTFDATFRTWSSTSNCTHLTTFTTIFLRAPRARRKWWSLIDLHEMMPTTSGDRTLVFVVFQGGRGFRRPCLSSPQGGPIRCVAVSAYSPVYFLNSPSGNRRYSRSSGFRR